MKQDHKIEKKKEKEKILSKKNTLKLCLIKLLNNTENKNIKHPIPTQ